MRHLTTCGNCKDTTAFYDLTILLTEIWRYHGGWLAPNIYFLGYAGCVRINGIRIAGASGIFKSHDFRLGMLPMFDHTPHNSFIFRTS